MADNVGYTEGAGKTIATDDVGSVHYQKIKLDVGGDGVSKITDGSVPVYIVSGTQVGVIINGATASIDTELPTPEFPQDTRSNPLVPGVESFMMAWNGSSWDRVKADSLGTGYLIVINSGTVHGIVPPDAKASSYPVTIGAVSEIEEDTAPSNAVDADGDVTRIAANRDGAVYTIPHPPRTWHYSQEFTAATMDYNIHSGLSDLSHFVESIYYVASGTVFAWIKDGVTASSSVKWKYFAGGVGDGVMATFNPAIKLSTNTHVGFSCMGTCFIAVTGYTAT